MNRHELQQLAEDRLLDAQALLVASRWSASYYLCGYAVECGLKSCVLAFVERTGVIFADKKYVEKCWTHNLDDLVTVAGLDAVRGVEIATNPAFANCWLVVKDWSETSRYQNKSEAEAQDLFTAVADNMNGVLRWIRKHW